MVKQKQHFRTKSFTVFMLGAKWSMSCRRLEANFSATFSSYHSKFTRLNSLIDAFYFHFSWVCFALFKRRFPRSDGRNGEKKEKENHRFNAFAVQNHQVHFENQTDHDQHDYGGVFWLHLANHRSGNLTHDRQKIQWSADKAGEVWAENQDMGAGHYLIFTWYF